MHLVSVFILSNQPLFAEGVQSLLSGQPGIKVVGVAEVASDTFTRLKEVSPDVVVIEAMGGEQGRLVAQVLNAFPKTKIIGLSLEDNRIHTYYQRMKQGRCVEDLLEAIRGPLEQESRSVETLRLFVLFQGRYGRRILENIRAFAPDPWEVEDWQAPADLPPVVDDPLPFLPTRFPDSDLILSLGESASVAQLLPSIVERTGAQAVIAPVDNVTWLPEGLARQLKRWLTDLGVIAVFPKPFCSLTEWSCGLRQEEVSYESLWISRFARHFGRPVFRVQVDADCAQHPADEKSNRGQIEAVEVVRDTPCGCGRAVAGQLLGLPASEAVIQAGLLHHHYPCLATMSVDPNLGIPLIHVAGEFIRHTVEVGVSSSLSQASTEGAAVLPLRI
ncbi:MAG TPA: hypothetical protein ENN19_03080 [Chloroflexi bacterium]|nr:hypothetical protein [Chloroflexota bacterium]